MTRLPSPDRGVPTSSPGPSGLWSYAFGIATIALALAGVLAWRELRAIPAGAGPAQMFVGLTVLAVLALPLAWLALSREFTERQRTLAREARWRRAAEAALRQSDAQLLAIARDVTAQQRLEHERRLALAVAQESDAKFRTLANAMPQIVWSTRTDGYHDYFNERWYEYTGMPRPADPGGEHDPASGGQGWNWSAYLHPDDVGHAQQLWDRSIGTGDPYQVEYRFRRRDGAFRWFIGRALPLRNGDGVVTRWFGTCTDIEDQKQTMRQREQLLAAERTARSEAERAVHAKNEFVATLSHELRTPLNAIMGWTQLLERDQSPPMLERAVAVINRNARAQAHLIDDLVDTSRILAGTFHLEPQDVHLATVIEAAITAVETAALAKEITIATAVGPVPMVRGDPQRLQQVLWNLLSNAIKFTPRGGRVRIDARLDGEDLEIAVSDNGKGISPRFLPLVFERFRQEDSTTTRHYGGLGLGLTIVKHLMELHGGTVSAASDGEGTGATFTIRMPCHHGTSQTLDVAGPAAPGYEAPLIQGLTILVVDDEADGREAVCRILARAGGTVHAAGSGEEALAVLRSGVRPAVLVSDIGMPGMDGYELIRQVRAITSGPPIPAAALTALARTEDRRRALLAGFQTHVAKPVDAGELLAAVASLGGYAAGHGAVRSDTLAVDER